ncbi:ribosomal L7Ae/L30e/S12e/Gadd45 family protein [Alkalibacter saccharofermentans]|jgi:large subunit ribosomal protein L7A|uniref:LSU ribosomal protein L7AE n=1 Tax=Alkalibacter saccharofermentans DSM 14828 TaxID=1120975 RepID=A0A1M5A227_9FIRM|nr:ribosomal L7Ae/L30e/S12e/Gadd45 family protein [Alkalibacter saccharofermentans]SHF24328.1 LSU ribosomal protein L7AE [Alkalibacter saccharofermentans DSM 14828]
MLDELKAGIVVVGTRQTVKTVKANEARLVYLAKDADGHITDEVESACKNNNVEIIYVDSMEDLGQACGIERKTAAAALLKE